ncbi:MAG TPA: rod shape-determining protein RodA [Balneolaceae bacterium]|nr:rod shape-determining protein RodA [Balneolaceae bacterium]
MKAKKTFDWILLGLWVTLISVGLVAIFSATQGKFLPHYIHINFYKQLIACGLAIGLLASIQYTDPKFFREGSYLLYGIGLVLMILTLLIGREVNGARSWLAIGPFNFQTSEFMEVVTILAAAHYLTSQRNISAENLTHALITTTLFLIPTGLVLLQNDTGTALIFLSLIPVMLFWSGLPYGISLFIISPVIIGYLCLIAWYWGLIAALSLTGLIFFIQRSKWLTVTSFICGLLVVVGVQVALYHVLQPYQRGRIKAFTNSNFDPRGAGWNVLQAKTAIGSGGFFGKGFMQGTQTQLRFLPEQWTDFIYCVIAEEFGFLGATIVLLLFLGLLLRLLRSAKNHQNHFAKIVVVGVTWVFFINFFINIGSASGLLPVIGLPLPFISYGGSALITNTFMLAICLSMDFNKRQLSIYR